MHGAHQLAQKFNTSSLPPKLDGVMVLPSSVTTLNLGAVSPALTTGGSKVPATTHTRMPASTATIAVNIQSSRFTLLF